VVLGAQMPVTGTVLATVVGRGQGETVMRFSSLSEYADNMICSARLTGISRILKAVSGLRGSARGSGFGIIIISFA
jgi:hypothetical protein